MKMSVKKTAVLCLMLGVFGKSLWAYQAALDDKNFSLVGSGSQHKIIVSNTDKTPIALELSVQSRSIDASGNETNAPIPDDWFILYPAQLVLKPGEDDVVRIAWTNKVPVDKEMAFRVVVGQVLLLDPEEIKRRQDDKKWDVKVDFVTRYMMSAFVYPDKARPRVILKEPELVDTESGLLARITFENTGTLHKVMKELKITLTPLDSAGLPIKSIDPVVISKIPAVVLLPGGTRKIEFPLASSFPKGKVRAEYTYQDIE